MQKSISLKSLTEEQVKEVVGLVNRFRKENTKSLTTQGPPGNETINKITNIEELYHNSELCDDTIFYMCELYIYYKEKLDAFHWLITYNEIDKSLIPPNLYVYNISHFSDDKDFAQYITLSEKNKMCALITDIELDNEMDDNKNIELYSDLCILNEDAISINEWLIRKRYLL